MTKEMLINTVEGQECRIAILRDGVLEELYMERASSASRVGNIYKGRVTNVEPSIQAAFVDFGFGKNGFLHVSDVTPQYFPKKAKAVAAQETVGRKHPRRDRPPIQECLRRGQEVVVQVTKEGIGTKGPTLTTYLSIPGRLLVLMPGMSRLGVSRKIEDDHARREARMILDELKLPADMGFIIRTAGLNRPKRDLQRDLNYLLRLWKAVKQRVKSARPPAEIYQESDLVIRTIRDVYNTEIERIICDSPDVARRVAEFLNMAQPRTKNLVELYTGKEGLFYEAGLEEEIEKIHARRVELPSGGSLVIDQAEALVAIDVNSGRFRDHSDAETTSLKTNLEAAREIVRQLRLRDLGGVIVMDFIDMASDKNRREVERALREAMKNDRAKTKVFRMSPLCIVEMTRQRVRPSLESSVHVPCPHCRGDGIIKSCESQALAVMRDMQRAAARDDVARIEVAVTRDVAHHLSNVGRAAICRLERTSGKTVVVRADASLAGSDIRFESVNQRGTPVAIPPARTAPGKLPSIDIGQLPPPEEAEPGVEEEPEAWGEAAVEEPESAAEAVPAPPPAEPVRAEGEAAPTEPLTAPGAEPGPAAQPEAGAAAPAGQPTAKKSRRRGRRGGRKHRRRRTRHKEQPTEAPAPEAQPVGEPPSEPPSSEPG